MGKLKVENIGQLNIHLNYYNDEVNKEKENPPIEIRVCDDKEEVVAEYALGGLSNQILISKYTRYIPKKEKLIKEIEAVLKIIIF